LTDIQGPEDHHGDMDLKVAGTRDGVNAIQMDVKIEGESITVSGFDKQLVGNTAAHIRSLKKPEPYKGKGIKYSDEHVRRKAGKAAKAIGSGS